ncbi:hypothetical protein O6H91_22G050700 [Diphasiastrum complanatum]|uniref:Uncharacterized protein n=1 Tax=Diphasiastrum complanatum TaxID=34168 RepID=A0ACC2AFD1_DIPCM|nr:hypothetical protein O6H91_22G050700 [Diphasiastrum complanatum]
MVRYADLVVRAVSIKEIRRDLKMRWIKQFSTSQHEGKQQPLSIMSNNVTHSTKGKAGIYGSDVAGQHNHNHVIQNHNVYHIIIAATSLRLSNPITTMLSNSITLVLTTAFTILL